MRGISTCVSGSPKRALNSMTCGSVGVPHQPAIQNPDVLFSFCKKSSQQGRENAFAHASVEIVGEAGRRGVGAHAAGIRSGVAIAGALVIAGSGERNDRAAVANCENAHFAAGDRFFEQHVEPATGNLAARIPIGYHGARRFGAGRDDYALSRSKSVGFNDDSAPPLRQRVAGSVERMYH